MPSPFTVAQFPFQKIPFSGFRFRAVFTFDTPDAIRRQLFGFSIPGNIEIPFESVDGIEEEVNTFEIPEISNLGSPRIFPDRMSGGRKIVFRRAQDETNFLFSWFNSQSPKRGVRQFFRGDDIVTSTISITVDPGRSIGEGNISPVLTETGLVFQLTDAWPIRISVSGLSAMTSGHLVNEVEFAYENMILKDS